MGDCTPVTTPIDTSPVPENELEYICPADQRIKYQGIVGSLMYIMLGTRGDIAYAVSMASQYLSNPGPQHVKLARRILQYLKGTKTLRLIYKGQLQMLNGFADADWAGCRDTRWSTARYLFNIGAELSAGNPSARVLLPCPPAKLSLWDKHKQQKKLFG
jgi:hypothetical protein